MGQNKTYGVLADEVGRALEHVKDCEQEVRDLTSQLNTAHVAETNAREALEKAKAELFEAHPELVPERNEDRPKSQLPLGA